MNAAQFPRSAKAALADLRVLQGEMNALLSKITSDKRYAATLYDAIETDDRKSVIQLLKSGGIRKSSIDSLELFPGNLRIKIHINFKKGTLTIWIS